MSRLNGKAAIPSKFLYKHILPAMARDPKMLSLLRFPYRRYFKKYTPESDMPISQISLRVNEVCNLACASCGQWGENGHLRAKQDAGHKLDQLDFDVVKRLIVETKHDKPVYYIWGGEPTLWKPLVPLFQELGKYNLYGSIVISLVAASFMILIILFSLGVGLGTGTK